MSSNINPIYLNITFDKNLKQSKFGMFHEGKGIEKQEFQLVQDTFEKTIGILNSKSINKKEISNIIEYLSNSEKGLKAIQLNLRMLSQNGLLEAFESVKVLDHCLKEIAQKIKEATKGIFKEDESRSLNEQVQIVKSQEKCLSRIKTQILCSHLIKSVHVKNIQASLKSSKTHYGSWIREMILNFSVIRKLIQYFFGGNENISKELEIDQLFKNAKVLSKALKQLSFT